MLIEIGYVEAIYRYPVKSMAGERLDAANLGWHGLDGDRRLAIRRIDNLSGMPWLTAGKLPDLLLFQPKRREEGAGGDIPTHISTPGGEELTVFGQDLAAEIGRRHGAPVQMMHLNHGIFDEASISLISTDTVEEIGRLSGIGLEARRFRPNIVLRLLRPAPFQEDEWVGGVLTFGEGDDAPAIAVTMRDVRCAMVIFDPDTASRAPEVLKTIVNAHQNTAGVYGAVTRIGRLAVGRSVFLRAVSRDRRKKRMDILYHCQDQDKLNEFLQWKDEFIAAMSKQLSIDINFIECNTDQAAAIEEAGKVVSYLDSMSGLDDGQESSRLVSLGSKLLVIFEAPPLVKELRSFCDARGGRHAKFGFAYPRNTISDALAEFAAVFNWDKRVFWHETLHLLGATDCYVADGGNCVTNKRTCDCANCIMQYNPMLVNLEEWPWICKAKIDEVKRHCGV